jgi:hypothetical protein
VQRVHYTLATHLELQIVRPQRSYAQKHLLIRALKVLIRTWALSGLVMVLAHGLIYVGNIYFNIVLEYVLKTNTIKFQYIYEIVFIINVKIH